MKSPISAQPLLPLIAAALLVAAIVGLGACHRRPTMTPAQAAYYADTLNRLQHSAYTDPTACLRQLEQLRSEGHAPQWKLDWVTATCHMAQQQRLLSVHYFEQALQSDSVQQTPRYYINLCRNLISEYIHLSRYDEALHYTRLLMQKADEVEQSGKVRTLAYQFLSRIYFSTGDTLSGLRAAHTAIQLARLQAEERDSNGQGYQARPLYDLAEQYNLLIAHSLRAGRLDEARAQLDTLTDINTRLSRLEFTPQRPDGIPRRVLDDLLYELYGLQATLCQQQGHASQVRQWAQRLEQPARQGNPHARARLIGLYTAAHRHADAIPLLQQQVQQQSRTDSFGTATRDAYRQLALSLRAIGRHEQAWQCMDRAIIISDTLNRRNNHNEILQTTALYENQEKAQRIAAQQAALRQQRIINITLGALAVLMAISLYLGYRLLSSTRRRNITMVKRIHEERHNSQNLEKRIREEQAHSQSLEASMQSQERRIDALMQALARRPLPPPGTMPVISLANTSERSAKRKNVTRHSPDIFNRLEKLLKEDQLFKQPQLKREDLMELLQTNKDTLNDTVQEYTGMSLILYLQNIRLDHAISLLESTNKSMEAIAQESGFPSVRSMQRYFKEKYDMSPLQYKKLQKK